MRSISCCTRSHVFNSFARLRKKFNWLELFLQSLANDDVKVNKTQKTLLKYIQIQTHCLNFDGNCRICCRRNDVIENSDAMFQTREAVGHLQMFYQIGVRCFLRNPVLESLFNKVAGLKSSATLLKRNSTRVFSCEIGEIFRNTFFYRTPLVVASDIKQVLNFQPFFV